MKKELIVTAAIAALLLGEATAATGVNLGNSPALASSVSRTQDANRGDWRWNECRFGGLQREAWTVREIVLTIRCAERQWPVVGGVPKALSVARCESGADLKDPGQDSYLGTFQQSARYWPGRYRAYSPEWDRPLAPNGTQPRSNVVVSIVMAHRHGWGAWSCAG